MNDRDQRRFDRALRVQTFGQENAVDFAPESAAHGYFAELAQLLLAFNTAKVNQTPDRASKETLLDALKEDFANISRTAQAIALKEPGFSSPYLQPPNSEPLRITHAETLLSRFEEQSGDNDEAQQTKATLRAKFIAYEMPENFVEDLRQDLEAIYRISNKNRGENLGGVENTAAIGTSLARISDVVQHLDALMHNKYARHPERLRTWQSASHVERAPKRKKESGEGEGASGAVPGA